MNKNIIDWDNWNSFLVETNGNVSPQTPNNGREFSLLELETFVGGTVEMQQTTIGWNFFCNEAGRSLQLPPNRVAMEILRWQFERPFVGNALFVRRFAVQITIGAFWKSVNDYYNAGKKPRFHVVDTNTHVNIGPKPKRFNPCSIEEWEWQRKSEAFPKEQLHKMFPGVPHAALSTVVVCACCLRTECKCDDFELAIFRACNLPGAFRS